MSFARRIEAFNTVRTRLTLLSAGGMLLLAGLSLFLVYAQIRDTLALRLDAALRSEWREFQSIYSAGGMDGLAKELGFEQHALGAGGGFMRAYNDKGLDVPSGDLTAWGSAAEPLHDVRLLSRQVPEFDEARGAGNGVRVRRLHGLVAPGVAVIMAYSQENNREVIEELRRRFSLLFLAFLAPVTVGSWLIAKATMQGVEAVTHTAMKVASGQFDQRVVVHGKGREIDELARAFNKMVDHLVKVFREIRETNDSIAHDLRSPITRIRAACETLLTSREASEPVQKTAADLVVECDNLLVIVNTMLDISEMEAGVRKLKFQAVDLRDIVHEACDLFAPALAERGVDFHVDCDDSAILEADIQLLRRAICNLLDNAVKYSNEGGTVKVLLTSIETTADLSIEDTGSGIAEQDLPRVFDRFYRGDKARSQSGSGLGLSLVRAIVTAHEGEVTLSSAMDVGTRATIRLPLAISRTGLQLHTEPYASMSASRRA